MSEKASDQDPRARQFADIAERSQREIGLINDFIVEIGGEDADIDDVLPKPPQVRDEAPDPSWDNLQIESARKLAAQLGFGAEFNKHTGLEKHVGIIEGGKVWKMLAEESSLDEEGPRDIIYAGTIFYIPADDERKVLIDQGVMTEEEMAELDANSSADVQEGEEKRFTQYDFAVWLAERRVKRLSGEEAGKPEVMPFGYEVAEDNPTVYEPTGQFSRIGLGEDWSVSVLRVDRELYFDEDAGKMKFRYQPKPHNLVMFTADVLTASGSDQGVAYATSNAYADRQIDTLIAGVKNGRRLEVNIYGRKTLADVKNAEMEPAGPRLNQLPGALRDYHDKSEKLLDALGYREKD